MAQHDYVIDNQTAPSFRADLNNALAAIVSTNSGASAPSPTYANMLWYDTAADILKMRNEANSAWINIGTLNQSNNTFSPFIGSLSSLPAAQLTGDVAAARITTALNATGSAPIYACRAWVNFNGTDTVAIRASGNVSSITDNGVGDYTVNFTTAMPDANYAAVAGSSTPSTVRNVFSPYMSNEFGTSLTYSTTAVQMRVRDSANAFQDLVMASVAIFR